MKWIFLSLCTLFLREKKITGYSTFIKTSKARVSLMNHTSSLLLLLLFWCCRLNSPLYHWAVPTVLFIIHSRVSFACFQKLHFENRWSFWKHYTSELFDPRWLDKLHVFAHASHTQFPEFSRWGLSQSMGYVCTRCFFKHYLYKIFIYLIKDICFWFDFDF
jgi:hypothetical protein